MNINPKIFKAYDIRGLYPGEVNEEVFYVLGRIFSAYLIKEQELPENKAPKIVVGRDSRLSSESLADSFIKGLRDFGSDVIDIGQITTPMLYFGVINFKAFGGAIITASHNPIEYNGVKFVMNDSAYVGGAGIQEIYKMIGVAETVKKNLSAGSYEKKDVSAPYLELIAKEFKINRKIKVVVDASSGVAGFFLAGFLKKLGIDYEPLFFEVDPGFKKHDPNPLLPESQKFAKEKIMETKADFGVVFDGDADRVIFLDENGNPLNGDITGALIAEGFLKQGESLCHILTSTKAIKEHFVKKGIRLEPVRVGRFFINKEMREKDVDFCSEYSGHYYFKSLRYTESAFLALRLVLEALDKNPDKKLSELAVVFQKYFHSGEINTHLSSLEAWPRILEKLKTRYGDGKQYFEDGIKVEYDDWWFNVRPSNTEPIARTVVEANTAELLEAKKNEVLPFLK